MRAKLLGLILSLLSTFILLCGSAGATIINVPADEPSIQAGIDRAIQGDTVLVAAGTYFENIDFKGKNIRVASEFLFSSDRSDIASTIIDGGSPIRPDSASCAMFVSGEDARAVLQGFTLTHGNGTVWLDEHGAGVFREGGGILVTNSSPTICDNIITENFANDKTSMISAGGGGIRIGDSNARVYNNVITHNQGLYGAGVVVNYAAGIFRNNVIAYNTGGEDFGGGGFWKLEDPTVNYPNETIFDNNTIVGNDGAFSGGGVRVLTTTLTGYNNIIRDNTATHAAQSTTTGVSFHYSDIPSWVGGAGNIDVDPLFSDTLFHLSGSSICIDLGNPLADFDDREDAFSSGSAALPSLGGLRNDIGAYGGPFSVELDPDNDDIVDALDNCSDFSNPAQVDGDDDWIGDDCDNCLEIYNPFQEDANGDGIGDICLHAVITSDSILGVAPLTVQFAGESDLAISSWNWEFSDGSTVSTLQSPQHTFTTPGVYTVTLSVESGADTYRAIKRSYIAVTADSLSGETAYGMKNGSARLDVFARNSIPLSNIQIPFSWSGDLNLSFDSASVRGLRTEYFESVSLAQINPFSKQGVFLLTADAGSGSAALPAGEGAVLSLYFDVPSNAPNNLAQVISLQQSGAFPPKFISEAHGSYVPSTIDATLTSYVCGDANSDDAFNIADVTFLIARIFGNGPAANPVVSGDANGSGSFNISDVTYLIARFFSGGPAPICGG